LERRRRRAVELLEGGEEQATVARVLGVNRTSLYRWQKQASAGPDALAAKPHKGPTPRLSDAQLADLEKLLKQGAKAHGWANQLWTAERVKVLILRHFGLSFHAEHVRKILKRRLRWSSQKPQTKARERNDKEAERWLGDEFPRIARDAFKRQAHLVFLDEAGFMLTPLVRRTLAPIGQTPVLPCWDRHDRISAISCVTLSPGAEQPGLYFELMPDNLNVRAEDIVAFLRELRRELPGPMTVIWDRHNIHSRSKLVQAYLAAHPEVVLEDFPGYCPHLNPDEMAWSWLKYGRLANLAAEDTRELREHLLAELKEASCDPELLAGFFNHAGFPLRL
jgi:transposase